MKRFYTLATALFMMMSSVSALCQELTDLSILKQGGYILFFRHASAPGGLYVNGGTGNDAGGALESQWWKSCDPATARQLSTTGRQEAIVIGRVMRRQGIQVGRLISSEFCRAYESAVLMQMNVNIQLASAATMTIYSDAERAVGLRGMIAQAPPAGTNTVVWTHATNQGDFIFAGLGWSDAAVYRYNSTSGTSDFIGTIRYSVWAQASTATSVAVTPPLLGELALAVSPNPTNESITLTPSLPAIIGSGGRSPSCDIWVVNALGQEMYSEADVSSSRTLDISSWAAGTYFVTLGTPEGRITKKFTKR